jgi:hypothetical protein
MTKLDVDGSFELQSPMTLSRSIYFDEEHLAATVPDENGKEKL